MKIEDVKTGMYVQLTPSGKRFYKDTPPVYLAKRLLVRGVYNNIVRVELDNTLIFYNIDVVDLEPYIEQYTCNIPRVTVELMIAEER